MSEMRVDVMSTYSKRVSFLDEAMMRSENSAQLQPVWVKAGAARLEADASHKIERMHLFKRVFDLSLVLVSAPVWAPVMLLIALAVKLDSRGPALFLQQRTGLNGQVFHIFKFRTMHHRADGDCMKQSQKHDNRHTRLGRLLRRTSLDELPQILNVLKGSMSLIGPRPHARYHDQLFMQHSQDYVSRFRARPGLTGWAQVNGQRGLLETQDQLQARTDLDNEYIENWSLWLDVKILFKTVSVVLKATNAH
jgi:putative colanic acid biosynthesis UDP-glucose lipid carrier transferase